MVTRATIQDLAREAGVSKSTVDRILNRRLPVREDTALQVLAAAERLGFHATNLLKRNVTEVPKKRFGFLLQKKKSTFYHALGDALVAETLKSHVIQGSAVVSYVDELDPNVIVNRLRLLAQKADALAIVSVDHPIVNDAVSQLASKGKPVFTLISDISSTERSSYLAVDSRRKGRTAAWTISRMAKKPGKVGILVGTHGYLSQEIVEMSFRSYFREGEPKFQVLEPVLGLEDDELTYRAVLKMIKENSDIVGIYSLGGGEDGFIQAIRESGKGRDIVVVCNEIMPSTRAGLIEGSVSMVLVTPVAPIAVRTVELMAIATNAVTGVIPEQVLFPVAMYNRESV